MPRRSRSSTRQPRSPSWPDAKALLARHGLDHPAITPARALTDAYTDVMFRAPSRRLALRHPGPTFVFEFAWRSPQYGAAHGLDVPFVFDTTEQCRGLVGDAAPESLARAMHQAWLDFAKHGAPGWPAFGATRKVMQFDAVSQLRDD